MNNLKVIYKTEALMKEHETKASNLYWKLRRLRSNHKLSVTDHALVRYLERVENLPIGEVLPKLLSPAVKALWEEFGDGTFPIADNSSVRVVIKQGVIVTVIK